MRTKFTRTEFDKSLYPHFEDGQPNLTAVGNFALAYRRPGDLHPTLIFNEVSEAFVTHYVESREWAQDATARGWRFRCLPAVGIGGTIQ